jgi:AraC-like DNA-binding protein
MSDWWSEVAEPGQWLELFDNLPGVFFYAKDLRHQFRRVNRAMAELHGCVCPGEMVGRGDGDFHPPALAAQYVEEDLEVVRTGVALLDRNWLVPGADGLPRWFLSSKFPLRNRGGRVVGIAGVMRPHEGVGDGGKSSYARLTPALKHVLEHFGEAVTVVDLAALCHVSVSQLQREFQRCFGCTPSGYLLGVRLLMARSRLQQTSDPIGVIALECGFYDQSHFTRAFQRANGLSPLGFRRAAQHGRGRGRV